MTSTDTLLPCPVPWCGSDVLEVVRSRWSRGYCITCQSCGVQSPSRETEAEATAAWNRRTTPTPATDAQEALDEAMFALSARLKLSGFLDDGANHAAYERVVAVWTNRRTPPTPAADEREAVALEDCPIGLFISKSGSLCLKTEYGDNNGRIDAYIVSSGEMFGDYIHCKPVQRMA